MDVIVTKEDKMFEWGAKDEEEISIIKGQEYSNINPLDDKDNQF